MQETDRRLAITAAIIFLVAGIAGGMDHWRTPNGFLPNICLLYLPCFAVWFGRRIENPLHAIGIPAGLGALLILPSLVIFTKGNTDDRMFAVGMTVLLPAIIAAASRMMKTVRPPPGINDDKETLRAAAKRNRLIGIIGVVLFPQLVQPATLDVALQLEKAGKAADHDAQIMGPAGFTKWIAKIALGIIGLAGGLSLLMALMDAFF